MDLFENGSQQKNQLTYQIDWQKNEMQLTNFYPPFLELSHEPMPFSPLLTALKQMVEPECLCSDEELSFFVDFHCKGSTVTVNLHRNDYASVLAAPQELLKQLLRKSLTCRETEVAIILFHGSTIRAAASQLHIAEGTVKRMIYNIYRKFKVASQVDLIREIYKMLAEAQAAAVESLSSAKSADQELPENTIAIIQ